MNATIEVKVNAGRHALREGMEVTVKSKVYQRYSEAASFAASVGGARVYTWQSGEGGYNRLVSHLTVVDIIGFVVLLDSMPEVIELPDDEDVSPFEDE